MNQASRIEAAALGRAPFAALYLSNWLDDYRDRLTALEYLGEREAFWQLGKDGARTFLLLVAAAIRGTP